MPHCASSLLSSAARFLRHSILLPPDTGPTVADHRPRHFTMCFVKVKEDDDFFRPARTSRRVRIYSESPPRSVRRVSRTYVDDRRQSYIAPPPEMRSTYTRTLTLPPPVPSYSVPPSTKPPTTVVEAPPAPPSVAKSNPPPPASVAKSSPPAPASVAKSSPPSNAGSKSKSPTVVSKSPTSRAPSKAPSRQSHYVEVNEESDTESDSSSDDVRSHATHKTSKTSKTSRTEKSSHTHKSSSPPASKAGAPPSEKSASPPASKAGTALSEFSLHEREREVRRYRGHSRSRSRGDFETYQYVEAPRAPSAARSRRSS